MHSIKNQLDVIKISGIDAESFIQGQITNDITLLSEEEKSIYAGYCSPKGRLLAFFFITKIDNNYFLFCPPCISETISKRLTMYVLRAKVEIICAPEDVDYFLADESDVKKLTDNFNECPYAKDSFRTEIRDMVNKFDKNYPSTKYAIVNSFLEVKLNALNTNSAFPESIFS